MGDVSLPPPSKNSPITGGSLSSELVFVIERRVWDNPQYPDGNVASPHNTGLDTDPQSLSVASGCRNPFILSRHQLQNLHPRCIRHWWPLNFSGAAGVEGFSLTP